jgi:hypothetical protein
VLSSSSCSDGRGKVGLIIVLASVNQTCFLTYAIKLSLVLLRAHFLCPFFVSLSLLVVHTFISYRGWKVSTQLRRTLEKSVQAAAAGPHTGDVTELGNGAGVGDGNNLSEKLAPSSSSSSSSHAASIDALLDNNVSGAFSTFRVSHGLENWQLRLVCVA